jgi:hypothetical protein
MTPLRNVRIAAALCVLATAGCASLSPDSPVIKNKLQVVSAGHTGYMPPDNEIANVQVINLTGDGTWNATCKGKTYLCSSAGTVNGGTTFSCAPVAQ